MSSKYNVIWGTSYRGAALPPGGAGKLHWCGDELKSGGHNERESTSRTGIASSAFVFNYKHHGYSDNLNLGCSIPAIQPLSTRWWMMCTNTDIKSYYAANLLLLAKSSRKLFQFETFFSVNFLANEIMFNCYSVLKVAVAEEIINGLLRKLSISTGGYFWNPCYRCTNKLNGNSIWKQNWIQTFAHVRVPHNIPVIKNFWRVLYVAFIRLH